MTECFSARFRHWISGPKPPICSSHTPKLRTLSYPSTHTRTLHRRMASSNRAAWLPTAKAYPSEIKESPYLSPGEDQIVVRTRALAANPVDWAIQAMGPAIFSFLQYPFILGFDISGEVVHVGPGNNVGARFKPGDRVIGETVPLEKGACEGGAQEYVLLNANMAGHIPASMTFEQAAVFPMGICTAASGLFNSDSLALKRPTVPAQQASGTPVLIWGGSKRRLQRHSTGRRGGLRGHHNSLAKKFWPCQGSRCD